MKKKEEEGCTTNDTTESAEGKDVLNRKKEEEEEDYSCGPDVWAIVVGAGISGLAATERISLAGFRVLCLEGQDRVGGRIWTHRTGTSNIHTPHLIIMQ